MSFFRYLIIFNALLLSKPEVGSSIIQRFGFFIKSYPIDVLFLSPADNPYTYFPPAGVSLQSFNPRISIYYFILSYLS